AEDRGTGELRRPRGLSLGVSAGPLVYEDGPRLRVGLDGFERRVRGEEDGLVLVRELEARAALMALAVPPREDGPARRVAPAGAERRGESGGEGDDAEAGGLVHGPKVGPPGGLDWQPADTSLAR